MLNSVSGFVFVSISEVGFISEIGFISGVVSIPEVADSFFIARTGIFSAWG